MFSALKRTLFDYSEECKADILYLLKKTCAFLIVGLIFFVIGEQIDIEWVAGIGGLCLLIFGFQWGRGLFGAVDFAVRFIKDGVLKWVFLFLGCGFIACLGYIYFLWCMIKLLIIFIKNNRA